MSSTGPTTRQQPLAGVRILAIEQMQALPFATQLLARLGADVIKVEHPERGDLGRGSLPAAVDESGASVGATYLRNNSHKRSIAIDLSCPAGRDLVLDLIGRVDVVAENFKPGTMTKFGLDHAAVAERHPSVVYVSVSGFGHTTESPYGAWPAFAPIAEAMSGMYTFKRPVGVPAEVSPVGALGDTGSGLFAAVGLLAALRHRDLTGEGTYVDIAMLDCMIAFADIVPNYWSMGADPRAVPPLINHGFPVEGGEVVVQIGRPFQFERLATLVGHAEWLDDDRFGSPQGWVDHLEILRDGVRTWAGRRTPVAAAEAMAAAGIAAAPVFEAADLVDDPHVAARHMLTPVADDIAGRGPVLTAGNPIKLAGPGAPPAEPAVDRPPPLGRDTTAVLSDELSLDADTIAALRADGVIA